MGVSGSSGTAPTAASCSSCSSSSGNATTGGSGTSCPICPGMPVWEVSEPYINLWLYDEPIFYQPGLGPRISFKATYKQRESRTIYTNVFSLGAMWDSSWISYVTFDPNNPSFQPMF